MSGEKFDFKSNMHIITSDDIFKVMLDNRMRNEHLEHRRQATMTVQRNVRNQRWEDIQEGALGAHYRDVTRHLDFETGGERGRVQDVVRHEEKRVPQNSQRNCWASRHPSIRMGKPACCISQNTSCRTSSICWTSRKTAFPANCSCSCANCSCCRHAVAAANSLLPRTPLFCSLWKGQKSIIWMLTR